MKNKNIVAIIQARMTSSRLPGKVLADLCGDTVLEHMLKRVARAKNINKIVVATTKNDTDNGIVDLCSNLGFSVFRGDEFDVLGRFIDIANNESADIVVRLTADCPMIDPGVIDEVVNMYKDNNFDYVSNGINERTYPDGLDVEVFSISALKEAHKQAKSAFCREHVTPYIRGINSKYESGSFSTGEYKFLSDFSHIRWTIDTAEDLEVVRELIKKIPENYTWLDALSEATKMPKLLGTLVNYNCEKNL